MATKVLMLDTSTGRIKQTPSTVGNMDNPMYEAGDLIVGQQGGGGAGNFTNLLFPGHTASITTNTGETNPSAMWDGDDGTYYQLAFSDPGWVRATWEEPQRVVRFRALVSTDQYLLLRSSNDGATWTTHFDSNVNETGMVDLGDVAPAKIWQLDLYNDWAYTRVFAWELYVESGFPGFPQRLPIGDEGDVLTVASGMPTWAPSTGGGSGDATSLRGIVIASGVSPSNGQALVYDSGNNWWEPATVSGGSSGGFIPVDIGASVYRTTAQSVPRTVYSTVTFNAQYYDTDGIHSTVTNPSRLTAQRPGKYNIGFNLAFMWQGTGQRRCQIRLNGTTVIGGQFVRTQDGWTPHLHADTEQWMEAGDYVELIVDHDHTTDTEVQAGPTRFWMRLIDGSADGNATQLQSLPIAETTPNTGQALVWDGTAWGPGNVAASGVVGGSAVGARFVATLTVDQNYGNGVQAKVQFTKKLHDEGNYYDAVNAEWVPPSGRVWLGVHLTPNNSWSDVGVYAANVVKNGATLHVLDVSHREVSNGLVTDLANGTDRYSVQYVQYVGTRTLRASGQGQAQFFGWSEQTIGGNGNALTLQGKTLSNVEPQVGQVLAWTGNKWEPSVLNAVNTSRVLLQETILTGNAPYFEILSIPQTYDHLEVELIARTTIASVGENLMIAFNGDSVNTNYKQLAHLYGVAHANLASDNNRGAASAAGSTVDASIYNITRTRIEQYATNRHKASVGTTSIWRGWSEAYEGGYTVHWTGTAPITSIRYTPDSGSNIVAGSIFRVWGIKSGAVSELVGAQVPSLHLFQSTVQSLTGGIDVPLNWDTIINQQAWSGINLVTYPSRIYIPQTGVYAIDVGFYRVTGVRASLTIRKNGTVPLLNVTHPTTSAWQDSILLTGMVDVSAGDYIEAVAYTSATVNTVVYGPNTPRIRVHKLPSVVSSSGGASESSAGSKLYLAANFR